MGEFRVSKAFRLVYLDFASAALDEDVRFYRDVMGIRQAEGSSDRQAWLSLGFDRYNLSFRQADSSSLESVGFQLTRENDIVSMAKALDRAGVKFERKTDARPGVGVLLEAEPVPGHVVHLMDEVAETAGQLPYDGVAPLRLGHFAVLCPDAAKLNAFYRDFLGFHHTDSFGDVVNFYTCNHEHHVLNIVEAQVPHRLHHLAFQLREYTAHARAADILARDSKPIVWGPTRHTAGHNVASYFLDDRRRLVELYTDMDVYLAELGIMEPRPWHEEMPQRPRKWARGDTAHWKTKFGVELSQF